MNAKLSALAICLMMSVLVAVAPAQQLGGQMPADVAAPTHQPAAHGQPAPAETQPTSQPGQQPVVSDRTFLERDGAVIVEVESVPPAGDWQAETDLKGYTGRCYYTWRGADLFNQPGQGAMGYRIRIVTPGRYNLRLHNRHDFDDATEENDVWTRMDDGKWTKCYSSWRGRWVWHSAHEHSHDEKVPASYELTAGDHVFYLSGRSKNFSVDRFVLYRGGNEHAGKPLMEGPESAMLPERTPSPAVPDLPAGAEQLPKVADAWREGMLGEAYFFSRRPRTSAGADVLAAVEHYAVTQQEAISKLAEEAPLAAAAMMRQLARQLAPAPHAGRMVPLAAQWENSPAGKDARAATDLLTEARKLAADLPDAKAAATQPALQARYDEVLPRIAARIDAIRTRFPETRARAFAETLAGELGIGQQ